MISSTRLEKRTAELVEKPTPVRVTASLTVTRLAPGRGMACAERIADLLLSALGLLLVLPISIVLACLIFLENPGPVLIRSRRFGLKGTTFPLFHFRTFVWSPGSLDVDQAVRTHASKATDARETRVGRCLRKLSIDGMPSLYNVFRGEMSFVGPAALTPDELDLTVDKHWLRLSVKPGLFNPDDVRGRTLI